MSFVLTILLLLQSYKDLCLLSLRSLLPTSFPVAFEEMLPKVPSWFSSVVLGTLRVPLLLVEGLSSIFSMVNYPTKDVFVPLDFGHRVVLDSFANLHVSVCKFSSLILCLNFESRLWCHTLCFCI